MKRTRTYLIRRRFLMGSLMMSLVFLLTLLAACGTNSGGTTTGSGPGGSGATATATKAPTTQNCGIVHSMRLNIIPSDATLAKGVENCFWQAYQQCHPAKLTYAQNELDTGAIHTFSLKSVNGSCVITDDLQRFIAPHPPKAAGSYTCAGLAQQSDGLHFQACGNEGNILVPTAGAQ